MWSTDFQIQDLRNAKILNLSDIIMAGSFQVLPYYFGRKTICILLMPREYLREVADISE